MLQIISANRLIDGRIVFRDASGAWDENPSRAARYASKEELAVGLAAAQVDFAANLIIEIEAVEVTLSGDTVAAVTMRDKVRFGGPSVLKSALPAPVHVANEQTDVSI